MLTRGRLSFAEIEAGETAKRMDREGEHLPGSEDMVAERLARLAMHVIEQHYFDEAQMLIMMYMPPKGEDEEYSDTDEVYMDALVRAGLQRALQRLRPDT
ncbi:MAG: hypothetical protein GDA50_04030 [Alphaproteobacteria bacterium GM202ARS2]|nr:hypothetical protein [Alphaproteobacteria bacterium GM202ARS2]